MQNDMGHELFSALYLGRLLSREAHARLLAAVPSAARDGWLTDLGDPRGRYVLHPPGCYVSLGSKEADGDAGQQLSELVRVFDDEILRREETLRGYVRAASVDGSDEMFGKYVVQGELWRSDDLPDGRNITHAHVLHNRMVQ